MATVYAVASSKGGVGKTTTTVNLGATLASAGLSVAVVDGDIGMANLGDALGIDPDGATLHDVLAENTEYETEDAVYDGPEGLAVVPGDTSIDGFRSADPANLARVVDALDDYDYVLVDTGAGLSHDSVLPLGLADEVVLVSTTERDSLTDTEKTRQVVDRLGGTIRGVVLTCVDPDDPNAGEVAERLSTDVIEAIPGDPVVGESMQLAEPLSSYAPASPAASAYRALASSLTGESMPTPETAQGASDETDAADAGDAESTDAGVSADDADPDTTDDETVVVESPDADGVESDADVGTAEEHDGDADATEGVDADRDDSKEEVDAADDGGITLGAPAEDGEDDEGITLTEAEDEADTIEEDAEPNSAADGEPSETDVSADDGSEATADLEGDGAELDGEGDDAELDDETVENREPDDESDDTETTDAEPEVVDDTAASEDANGQSRLTDDDALAADTAPSDDPLVADSADPTDEADGEEDPVFTTSLVEEAEPTDGGSEETSDTEFVETDETDEDDEDDDGGKGFLGRLLG